MLWADEGQPNSRHPAENRRIAPFPVFVFAIAIPYGQVAGGDDTVSPLSTNEQGQIGDDSMDRGVVMFQDILPVERWGFSYAAQIEAAINGSPLAWVMMPAAMEPG